MKMTSKLLLAGLVLAALPPAAHAAEKFVPCPVKLLDTQVTTRLTDGWWATPQRGELLGTDIRVIGGERTLVCNYRGFGISIPVMHRVPPGFAKCIPQRGGFTCSTLLRAPDVGIRFRDRKLPPPPDSSKSGSPPDARVLDAARGMKFHLKDTSPIVRSLSVEVCSGRDNLRRGSVLTMSWSLRAASDPHKAGMYGPEHTLFTEIPSNRCGSASIIAPMFQPFPLSRLESVRLTFRGGRRGFPDATDDWDMTSIAVFANTRDSRGAVKKIMVVKEAGNPLRHFNDSGAWVGAAKLP